MLALACALALAVYGALMHYVVTVLNMVDFAMFYCSIRSFAQGQDMYGPCTTTSLALGQLTTASVRNLNPPHAHLPWLPLAFLEPVAALAIWDTVGLLALLASVWLIARALGLRYSAIRLMIVALAVLFFSPTGAVLLGGESTFLLLLPVTLAWLMARQDRWLRAGILLGLAISVKPFLLVFLPYLLVRRRLQALGASVGTLVLSYALGLLVFGVPAYRSWLTTLAAVNWGCQEYNASLLGLFSRLLTSGVCGPSALNLPWLVEPAWIAAAGFVGLVTFLLLAFSKSNAHKVDGSFAILILAALLISPLGWPYYLWLAVGPFAAWFVNRRPLSLWQRGVLASVSPCLVGPFTLGALMLLPSTVAGSVQTWAVLGLWIVLVANTLEASLNDYSAALLTRTSSTRRVARRLAHRGWRRLQALS